MHLKTNMFSVLTMGRGSDIIKLTSKEVFIDVGAYNGDTMREFLDVTNKYFSNIIAYELDKNNFGKLQKEIQNMNP